MRVFVTGATGLVGRALCGALAARGDAVVALTRRPPPDPTRAGQGDGLPRGVEIVRGDPAVRASFSAAVAGCDAVVHLAGASIGGRRWSAAYKRAIWDSRIDSTRAVVEALETSPADRRPRTLLVASGIDAYPFDEGDRAYAEDAPLADTWLARLCTAWEAEARAAERWGVRVASLRMGFVLARGGEAVTRMATPFRLFAGGPLGSGRQWVSWVHLDDVVAAWVRALDDAALRGPVNVVAPAPVRQAELARAFGAALRRPSWAPVPGLAARLAVGELAQYFLNGRRAVPAVLARAGFAFRWMKVTDAVADCLRAR